MSVGMTRADPEAQRLAERMIRSEATMANILDETVSGTGPVKESGRTACGGLVNVTGPLKRFSQSVELESCPRARSGTWHSHVTEEQLRNPEHSLPDMANVVFGNVDASIVVGAETSDVFVAAEDRQAMVEDFQNVLGLKVESTKDVVDAQTDGPITDSPSVRSRARQQFAPLFQTYRTEFKEIQQQLSDLDQTETVSASAPAGGIEQLEPMYVEAYVRQSMHTGQSHSSRIRNRAKRINSEMAQMKTEVIGTALSSAINTAASRAVSKLF